MTKIIFTTQFNDTISKLGLNEIKASFKVRNIECKFDKWVSVGIGVMDVELPFEDVSDIVRKCIFIQHIFPVSHILELNEKVQEELSKIDFEIRKNEKIAVQGFSTIDNEYIKKSEVAKIFIDKIEEKKGLNIQQDAESSISFVMNNKFIYVGKSLIRLNLSSWTLGQVRFKREDNQISRAEFKLLEAFEVFNINGEYETALDLGAAPGGFTRVLLSYGLMVSAVDPANLDKELLKDKNVKFYNMSSQDFIKRNSESFDIIVNDMKMDGVKSAEIMNEFSGRLNDGGIAVFTLKLPENKQLGKILDTTRILETNYKILKVKQLFHNRSEVTFLLRGK